MTQKEKLKEALMFAQRVKVITNALDANGNDYDVTWHKVYTERLLSEVNNLIKLLKLITYRYLLIKHLVIKTK